MRHRANVILLCRSSLFDKRNILGHPIIIFAHQDRKFKFCLKCFLFQKCSKISVNFGGLPLSSVINRYKLDVDTIHSTIHS